MNNLNILLVDDADRVRIHIAGMLRDQPGIGIIQMAANIMEAQIRMNKEKIDAVVLDISLPDGSGVDFLKWVKHFYPETHVIMLSNNADRVHRAISKEYGAFRFLDKTGEFDKLPGILLELSLNDKIAG